MDRLDEDFVESDVVQRDPEAINSLLENGKGFSKYLQDIIKFHDKILSEENDHSKNLARAYLNFRPWTVYKAFVPLKKIYESSTFQSSQCMSYFDDSQHAKALHALEDLKAARTEFIAKCKLCKDHWRFVNAKVAEAKDNHKTAKTLYNKLGRELDRLGPALGEESYSVDGSGSDVLDVSSMEQLDMIKSPPPMGGTMNKRERQRVHLEQRFADAEEDYRNSVNNLVLRLNERSDFHVNLLMLLRKAFRDADESLGNTEKAFLHLRREKLHESLVKIESQLNCIREYKPQACYLEWIEEKMHSPISNTEETNITFVPHIPNGSCKERFNSSSIPPLSPSTSSRNRQNSPNIGCSQETGLSTDLRDSVDGSSDGSTPGSTRKGPFRNSYDSASKTPPDGAAVEEEIRSLHTAATAATKASWIPKPLRNILGGRGGSAGSGSSSPPPSTSSLEDDVQKAEQVVSMCIAALEKKGLSTTGLYRRGAGEARTNRILSQLEDAADVSVLEEEDPHLICNVIKKCFLKLREPIFTEALYSKFVQIGATDDAEDALLQLKEMVAHLPPGNRRLASLFISHLNRVAEDPDNQMTTDSLGTCVVTLMQSRNLPQIQNVPNSRVIAAIANTDEIRRVLTLLIENVDFVFEASEQVSIFLPNLQDGKFHSEEISLSMSSPVPLTSNSESISDDAKCSVNSRPTTDSMSTSSQVSCSVYFDSATQRLGGKGPPFSTSACGSPPAVESAHRPASTSLCPSPLSLVPVVASASPAKDSPPPVPPSLGRTRPVEVLTQHHHPHLRKLSSDNKQAGAKSRGSKFFNLKFRRNKSLDSDTDLDRAMNHGCFEFPPDPSKELGLLPDQFSRPRTTPPCRPRHATPHPPETRRIIIPNGPRAHGVYGPPPIPPPKPQHLSQSGHTLYPKDAQNGYAAAPTDRVVLFAKEAEGVITRARADSSPLACVHPPLARRNSEPVTLLPKGSQDRNSSVFYEECFGESPRDRRALSHPLDLADDVLRRLPPPRRSQPEFV